jgi:hypothetical protein
MTMRREGMTEENEKTPEPRDRPPLEEMSEDYRRWDQMQNDECYRDVQGLPCSEITRKDVGCCLLMAALLLLPVAAAIILVIYLL